MIIYPPTALVAIYKPLVAIEAQSPVSPPCPLLISLTFSTYSLEWKYSNSSYFASLALIWYSWS